jgi:hypothetical protein
MTSAAAILFAIATALVVAFQGALALGAPWGAYAMGGTLPGRWPPAMRLVAVGQAVLLAALAFVVLDAAGLVDVPVIRDLPALIWLVVAVSAVSLAVNAVSRSAGERRIWVPVALVMLGSSVIVALTAR